MNVRLSFHDLATLDAGARAKLLQRSEIDLSAITERVKPIIEAVARDGDEALARFGREFDGASVSADRLKASEQEFDTAFEAVEPESDRRDPFRGRQHPLLPRGAEA